MNDSLFAVICIGYAQIFCGKISRDQQIVFIDAAVFYDNGSGCQPAFFPVGIGILFIFIKDDLLFSIGQSQFSGFAAVRPFYFCTIFDQCMIIRKHIYLIDLNAWCFAKRYGFAFVSKGQLFSAVLIIFSTVAYRQRSAPYGSCHHKTAEKNSCSCSESDMFHNDKNPFQWNRNRYGVPADLLILPEIIA